jgi:hypothetical protein
MNFPNEFCQVVCLSALEMNSGMRENNFEIASFLFCTKTPISAFQSYIRDVPLRNSTKASFF